MSRLRTAVAAFLIGAVGFVGGIAVTSASATTTKECSQVRSDVARTKLVLNTARQEGLDAVQAANADQFEVILNRALAHCS